MPKNQEKKCQVKKSAKERAYDKNTKELNEIIKELEISFNVLKKNLLNEGKQLTKDNLENKNIVIGRIQLGHGFMFQVQLMDERIVQVVTPGNAALHDMIKQLALGTHTNIELQPYILINISGKPETLALLSDPDPELTKHRFKLLENSGIRIPKKDIIDDFIMGEEEIQLGDL